MARYFFLGLLLLHPLASLAGERAAAKVLTDMDGDPLPPGAVARIGSARWRLRYPARQILVSPDGKSLAVGADHLYVEILDAASGKRLAAGPSLPAKTILSFGGGGGSLSDPTCAFSYSVNMPMAISPDWHRLAVMEGAKGDEHAHSRDELVIAIHHRIGKKAKIKIPYVPMMPPEMAAEVKNAKAMHTIATNRIGVAAFSPDANILAMAYSFSYCRKDGQEGKVLQEGQDCLLRLWDVSAKKELRKIFGHKKEITAILFSPDGKTVTTASEDGSIRFSDVSSGKGVRAAWKVGEPVISAVYSPDRKWLAAVVDREVLVFSTATEMLVHRLRHSTVTKIWNSPGLGPTVAFSRESNLLAFAYDDRTICFWDVLSGKKRGDCDSLANLVVAMAFSADGKTLFSGHFGEQGLRRWDVATRKLIGSSSDPIVPSPFVDFSADGKQFVFASDLKNLQLWDFASRKTHPVPNQGKRLMTDDSLTFLAKPDCQAVGGGRGVCSSVERLVVKDLNNGKILWETKGERAAVALAPNGKTVALVADHVLRFCDVDTGKEHRLTLAAEGNFVVLLFSPDGSTIALIQDQSEGFDDIQEKISIFSSKDGRRLAQFSRAVGFEAILSWSNQPAFSPNGQSLLIYNTFLELATGQSIRKEPDGTLTLSPDNRLHALLSESGSIKIKDFYTGELMREVTGHGGLTMAARFSPDSKLLAAACLDTSILLWDASIPEKCLPPLDDKTLRQLWDELETGPASRAYPAMGRLIADPLRSVPFLTGKLQPIPPADVEVLRRLLAAVDDANFRTRESARKELGELGPCAELAIRAALARKETTLEARRSLTAILNRWEETHVLRGTELAHIRAIQVLERIANKHAIRLLEHISKGVEAAPRTRTAREALARIHK